MALLTMLHPGAGARSRVSQAVSLERVSGARHTLAYVDTFAQLESVVCRGGPNVAIVDPYVQGALALDPLERLRRDFPSSGLIVYGDFTQRPARDILALGRIGIEVIISYGVDDTPREIRPAILSAIASADLPGLRLEMEKVLARSAASLVQDFLLHSIHVADVTALASSLGMHLRTLERRIRREHLPPAARLFTWCRLLHAARLLEDRGRTVDNTAQSVGYTDGTSLRRALKRETGMESRELRSPGGQERIGNLFIRFVGEQREQISFDCRV